MGSEPGSSPRGVRSPDGNEEYEEAGGGSRWLGFMFGNVDNSGELEVDYLDEDTKEHLDKLASELGQSLIDIELSGKSPTTPAAAADVEDYDEKAEDAVDYEDIEEQYEGPETTNATEEDHLLPRRDFVPGDASANTFASSVFDDENYDEDEDYDKNSEAEETVDEDKTEPAHNSPVNQEIALPAAQLENDVATLNGEISSGVGQTFIYDGGSELLEEEPSRIQDVGDVRSMRPLPILCVEDGMAVLRFSEIFGVSEPLKKSGEKEHKYSVSKDKYTSLAAPIMVEENEEALLKGSCQVFSSRKPPVEAATKHTTFLGDDSEFDKFGLSSEMCVLHDETEDLCLSSEPLRKDGGDFSVDWKSCISKESFSFDQQDWENTIVWGNSPTSENSVDICELSELDSEVAAHEERECTPKPATSHFSDGNSVVEEKQRSPVNLSAFSVEPFDSRDSSTDSFHHPQFLRLESRLVMSSSRELASAQDQNLDFMKRFKKLAFQNKDLVEGSWIENIMWESEKPIAKSKLILDLQDEHMVFQISDSKEYERLRALAAAVITLRTGNADGGAVELSGHVALRDMQFNIANDKYYSDRRTTPQLNSLSKKRVTHGVKILHSVPAWTLQTMKPKLSNKDVANFHRPKALWYPHDNEVAVKELSKLPTKGPMKVLLKSLGSKGSKIYVEAEETVSSFKTKASRKLDFSSNEAVKIYYSGKELQDEKTFAEQNVLPNSLLHLVRTKIHLLPVAQILPTEKKSLRPPGAFKKKSDLSARDGHAFLMEYCEERPLLLGNPGMGARLNTYYQKSSTDDQKGELLRNANSGLGAIVTLDPADKSPFLGDIQSGCSQSSLETELYKAPLFPHRVASTDYLLVRSPKGKLSLRRIDKIHVVGQQEPLIEVMSPSSKNPQNYLWNRLLVYMYREFRSAQKRNLPPCIRAAELSAQFPNIAEPFVRKRLKHCADLQKGPNGRLQWVMRRNFHIPPEEELRKMLKPETVCAYESMLAGLYRLKRQGISRLIHLSTPTQLAALSSAMNQLPDEALALAAASHIERELQITPWNLSANFVACFGQEKGNMDRLEISGVGDPSGRGLGFSYVRSASKTPASNSHVKKKQVVARGTTLTGTDADLRRLSMGAAKEVLLKFNVPEEQIGKLTRWHRIALIRKLSSEQAASGAEVDNKFARGQRMSFLQLQQQTREKCQDIWARQVQSLSAGDDFENESDTEANSDLDSFAGDLENILDAEVGEEEDEGALDMKNSKSDEVKGLKMRRHPPHARHEEEYEDEAAEAAELCRVLMEGNEAKWKKKKKSRPSGEEVVLVQDAQRNFVVENAPQVKRPIIMVEQTDGATGPNNVFSAMRNDNLLEVGRVHSEKTIPKKAKLGKKNEVLPWDLLNKKVKIMTDNSVGIKNRKSARETFICGACGQKGHMRTNKYCPRYREDPEMQLNNVDVENETPQPTSQDPSQSQQRDPIKNIPKIIANGLQGEEASEGGTTSASTLKPKILKVKYAAADKASDKVAFDPSKNSEQPSTSQPEVGNKSSAKVIKIVSNKKPDDLQAESQKINVVIRPPSETSREHFHKKITIKQPKKEVINLDLGSEDDTEFNYLESNKMIQFSAFSSSTSRHQEIISFGEDASRKNELAKRMWEEEEKRRNAERIQEEQARRYEEEKRLRKEQENLAELRRYEEEIQRERVEEEIYRANRKTKKKRTREIREIRDDYFEEFREKSNGRMLPGRERSAKRKSTVEVARYEAGHVPASKRRRGGEVGLANILEEVVEILKSRLEVSYLFQKPVSKKEAPDYFDVVEYPMDLGTIKEKVRRLEYKNRDEFRHDVWQIAYNAHLYNDGRNPGIPPLADQLLEICDYLLHQRGLHFDEAEANIRDT